MGGVTEHMPHTMLPIGRGFASEVVALNFRAWLASAGVKPHRCSVKRKSRGRWAWTCREDRCGGADWYPTHEAAFGAAYGHASGWTGPYPYRQGVRMAPALERRPTS